MKTHVLTIMIAVMCLLGMTLVSRAASFDDVGLRVMTAMVPERGKSIELMVWYPAKQDGIAELVGDSKLFKSVPARRDATPADGKFPVVLLAFGGMRANFSLGAWIAAYLAARGNLVVMTQPPQLGEQDASSAIREIWLRPSDLSAGLSAIEADAEFSSRRLSGKTAAVGFFLGGTSALAVAGARIDGDSYRQYCDKPWRPDCRWFAASGVDLHKIDIASVSASHHDARFKVVIAVNPELSKEFDAESLRAIAVPVEVITLGPADSSIAAVKDLIPGARSQVIADATQFSAFSQCTPQAASILVDEREYDFLCRDGGGRTRGEIQAALGQMIDAALSTGFQGK